MKNWLHNIDFFNRKGTTTYQLKGGVPAVDGQMLNWLAPIDDLEGGGFKNLFKTNLEIEQIKAVISSCFEYQGLPTELDALDFEYKLVTEGQLALVKNGPLVQALTFSVVVGQTDIYNNPTKITITDANSSLKGQKINDFVIVKNDMSALSLWVAMGSDINAKNDTLNHLHNNLTRSLDRAIVQTDKPQTTLRSLFSKLSNSLSQFIPWSKADSYDDELAAAMNITKSVREGVGTDDINLIVPPDRGESLTNQYIFWDNRIKEAIGLNINMLSNATRAIQGEIAQQQGRNTLIMANRLAERKKALEKANILWDLSMTVEYSQHLNAMIEGMKNNADNGGSHEN